MRTTLLLLSILFVGCAEREQQSPTGDGGGSPTGDTIEATDHSASPDSDQGSCPFLITEYPPPGKARLLAAYKICPGCMANLPEYLMKEHGQPAAYLYDDGRLLFRVATPVGFVHQFQEKTVTETEACGLLDEVDLEGLADEGVFWHQRSRGMLSRWNTRANVRGAGGVLSVGVQGSCVRTHRKPVRFSRSVGGCPRLVIR